MSCINLKWMAQTTNSPDIPELHDPPCYYFGRFRNITNVFMIKVNRDTNWIGARYVPKHHAGCFFHWHLVNHLLSSMKVLCTLCTTIHFYCLVLFLCTVLYEGTLLLWNAVWYVFPSRQNVVTHICLTWIIDSSCTIVHIWTASSVVFLPGHSWWFSRIIVEACYVWKMTCQACVFFFFRFFFCFFFKYSLHWSTFFGLIQWAQNSCGHVPVCVPYQTFSQM